MEWKNEGGREGGREAPPTLRYIRTLQLQFMVREKLEVGQFASS